MFEHSETFYYLMYLVGFAIMMIVDVTEHKRYGIKKKSAVIYTLITYVCGVSGAMVMGKIYTVCSLAAGSDDGSRVAIFGALVFTPLFLLIILLITDKDKAAYMDMLTPGIFIILTCAKFGCFLNGCCAGKEWERGIYNPRLDMSVFPIQLPEVAAMICIVVFTQLYFRKKQNYVKGTAFPVTAAVYCAARFCFEFGRYYPENGLGHVFLGMTFWQLWCIALFAVCALIVYGLNRQNKTKNGKK